MAIKIYPLYSPRLVKVTLSLICISLLIGCDNDSTQSTVDDAGLSLGGETMVIIPDESGDMAGDMATAEVDLSQVKINEISSKGDPFDWVEIYNQSSQEINLSGYWLSDTADELDRYLLPEGIESLLPAQGFALFILDSDSTGFALSGNEGVYLSSPQAEVIDYVEYTAEDSQVGTTYGRLPDGTGEWQLLYSETPNGPNMSGMPPECGDGICEPTESCEADCVVCGDGVCNIGERCEDDCQLNIALVINEISAAGSPDGAELANVGEDTIDLSTLYITDDRSDPTKFRLEGELEASDYLWLPLTDETVGFKLKSDEELFLFDEDQLMIDGVDWEEGDSPEGLSYHRSPDLVGEFTTGQPTPGESND